MTKEQMAKSLRHGAEVAKQLGGAACNLAKRGIKAAREKMKELNEKAKIALDERRKAAFEERRMAEIEACRRAEIEARRREAERERAQSQKSEGADRYHGDPRDKSFEAIRVGLYILWWIGNIGYTLLCFKWASVAADSYFSRDSAWIPLALLPLLLMLNWGAYELAVAIFEIVRHLRQIRDELHRHNMREGRKRIVKAETGAQTPSA